VRGEEAANEVNRETTNVIRYFLEELLPPVVRDSRPMRWLFRAYWGRLVNDLEDFRARAHYVGEQEYNEIYAAIPRIQQGTDNSEACIQRVIENVSPGDIVDVGCGTGLLLERIIDRLGTDDRVYTGVDIHVDDATREKMAGVRFEAAMVENLPFEDKSFDTVICTHVLEHILDIRQAVSELRRVCRRKLIVVVPKEREYRFTFNPHLHFFAYRHSFLRHMIPVPEGAVCEQLGRDFFYMEDVDTQAC
jgi:2-polyprenyl-3-methyl-5-hydroxy-6-metoxy-1,4-benzoquinol methylase